MLTRDEITEKLKLIYLDVIGTKLHDEKLDTAWVAMPSLLKIEFVMDIEDAFIIEISDSEGDSFTKIEEIINLIENKLKEKGN